MSAPTHPLPAIQSLVLRRMGERHLSGVIAIESVSFGQHHWSESSFRNEFNNPLARYYVLTNDEDTEVLGYCGYWLVVDEVHITTLAVSPALRGLSLGEVQVLHILEKISGQSVHWVTLEVRTSNQSAQTLYYKYGFKTEGLRKQYYQDNGEDALIMTTPDIGTETYRQLLKQKQGALRERLGGLPTGFGTA
ncbi:MAG: ribosomal protein S18-alanine N-acetyltransferase [Vampirovibrionales bacterium]|nr:ribosomal protein S18-alanine N-acetyltransferase [Vampirovibrionales bacterium]